MNQKKRTKEIMEIYKYLSIDDKIIDSIFLNNIIKYSEIINLNDPFELQPVILRAYKDKEKQKKWEKYFDCRKCNRTKHLKLFIKIKHILFPRIRGKFYVSHSLFKYKKINFIKIKTTFLHLNYFSNCQCIEDNCFGNKVKFIFQNIEYIRLFS